MKKKLKKLNFTLVEITVAFGILTILIMFLMQFLTTAQTSWTFAEKRARAYADSRTALDFIERGLMSTNRRDVSAITINPGSTLIYKGTLPYGNGEYKDNITVQRDAGAGVLQFDGNDLIENVTEFYIVHSSANSYLVRIDMFGSKEDYRDWLEESNPAKKNELKARNGFKFIRLINLQ